MEVDFQSAPTQRVLSFAEAAATVSLGVENARLMSKRGEFVQPIRLSARRVGVLSNELDEWIASRPRANEPTTGAAVAAARGNAMNPEFMLGCTDEGALEVLDIIIRICGRVDAIQTLGSEATPEFEANEARAIGFELERLKAALARSEVLVKE